MLKKSLVTILTAAMCIFSGSVFAYNGNIEDVTLSVTVERKINPDIAFINYSVIGSGTTSKEAAMDVAEKAGSIKKALLKHAIINDMLEQASYRVSPVYNDKQKITGYKAYNAIKVRVDDLDKLGDVIDTLSASGADNIGNISYDIKNKDIHQAALIKEAVQLARQKASLVAEAGGRGLGRLLSARLNSYTTMPRMANTVMLKASGTTETISTVIENKSIEIRADIETVFALD